MDYSNEANEMLNDDKFCKETALGRKMTKELTDEQIWSDTLTE
jgi:hypothetical protein